MPEVVRIQKEETSSPKVVRLAPGEVYAAEPPSYLELARQIAGTIANAGLFNFLDEGLDLVNPGAGQRLRDDIATLEARRPAVSAISSVLGSAANPANAFMALGTGPIANTLISAGIGAIEGAGAAEGGPGERLLSGALPSAAVSALSSGLMAGLQSRDNLALAKQAGRKTAKELELPPSEIPSPASIGALRELIRASGLSPNDLQSLAGGKAPFPETQINSSLLHMVPELGGYVEDVGRKNLFASRAIGQALKDSSQQVKQVRENVSSLYKELEAKTGLEAAAGYEKAGIPSVRKMSPYERSSLALDERYLVPMPDPEDAEYLLPKKVKNAKGKEVIVRPAGAKLIDLVRKRTPGFENYPDNHLLLLEEAYQVANNKSAWENLFAGRKGANTDFNSTEARDVRGMLKNWLDKVAPDLSEVRARTSLNLNRMNALLEGEDYAKTSLSQGIKRDLPWFMKKAAEEIDPETRENFFKGYLAHIATIKDENALSVLRTQLKDPKFKEGLRSLWRGDEESFQGFLKNAEALGRAQPANRIVNNYFAEPGNEAFQALFKDALAASAGSIYARINLAHRIAEATNLIKSSKGGELVNLVKLIVSPDDRVAEFAIKQMKFLDAQKKAQALSNAIKIGASRGVGQEVFQGINVNE